MNTVAAYGLMIDPVSRGWAARRAGYGKRFGSAGLVLGIAAFGQPPDRARSAQATPDVPAPASWTKLRADPKQTCAKGRSSPEELENRSWG